MRIITESTNNQLARSTPQYRPQPSTSPVPPENRDASPESAIGDLLREARALVAPALRVAVASLPGAVARIASYHFGWTDLDGRGADAKGNWGKGIRSALVLACARAVGGQTSSAVPAAVAIELVHNASLIHDDLIDRDPLRRHRPAVWAAANDPSAILLGDSLFFAAIHALHAGPSPHLAGATAMLLASVQQLIDGELADTAFETRREVSLDECLKMTAAKTGALMEGACGLGARYGGAIPKRIAAMGHFGRHLGVAFQVIDDYLGIWGVSAVTGKPVLADLRRRKKSLPVVWTLAAQTPESAELASLYQGDSRLTDTQVQRAAELIEHAGARTWAHDYGRQQINSALEHLAAANPTPEGRKQLTALAHLVRDRES